MAALCLQKSDPAVCLGREVPSSGSATYAIPCVEWLADPRGGVWPEDVAGAQDHWRWSWSTPED